MKTHLPKLIVILGPTSSGKSSLGITLAKKFNGEIISADSRQVFRGLDIGSGKVTKEEQARVPHHLLDVVRPMEEFSVARFQQKAFDAIDAVLRADTLPFLVGGTALYLYAVIDHYAFAHAAPNEHVRAQLEKKSVAQLQRMLSAYPHSLNAEDALNKRRLIRAIEKHASGAGTAPKKYPPKYDPVRIGIDIPRTVLYRRIDQRVDERIAHGMIEEVEQLLAHGIRGEWLLNLGLEYKYITQFLRGRWDSKEMMVNRLKGAIHAFARRQMTWFKRDKRIHWVKNTDEAYAIMETRS